MFKSLDIVREGSVATGPQEKRWVGLDMEERKEEDRKEVEAERDKDESKSVER